MRGTLFSADFVKDSNGSLRLLELNTDTGFNRYELNNFDYGGIIDVLNNNNITTLDIIYKPVLHAEFVIHFSSSISLNLPGISTINLYEENSDTIYPSIVEDTTENFILRLAYDESALFDSEYCKNRLNVYNLFYDNTIFDNCVSYYHSSSVGEYNTLTKEINESNIPDATIKDINESFNPIDFFKIGFTNETETFEERWNGFLQENVTDDKLVEQYHFHSSSLDINNHITSIRFQGIVYGSDLNIIPLHNYTVSSIFDLPTTITSEIYNNQYSNKIADNHYYEYTTNFAKNDSAGILSLHSVLSSSNEYKPISEYEIGESLISYFVSGSQLGLNYTSTVNWSYEGNTLPVGSFITSSIVVYKDIKQLKYNSMFELKVDNDSLFSGFQKKYLIFDSETNKTTFKFIFDINPTTDSLYGINGELIDIDELNFYVSTDDNLTFIELDVEDTDTYIISGSTAFNSVVSHNAPCFIAGTQILLEDGTTKNIEDVIIGDSILSFDLKNQESKVGKVLSIFSKKVDKIVEYQFINGGLLRATLDHPIYVVDKGWSSYSEDLSNSLYKLEEPVKKIQLNDVVKLYDEEVKLVNMLIIEGNHIVYNLNEIDTFHNYFANNVLVHNRCFIAGTKITLPNGEYKNIEDIVIGENVITYNEESQLTEVGIVGDLKTHIVDNVIDLIFDNKNLITTTLEHPFFVKNKGWVEAKNLKKDDICLMDDNTDTTIIDVNRYKQECIVYNLLSVSNNNNFYANKILVHNKQ